MSTVFYSLIGAPRVLQHQLLKWMRAIILVHSRRPQISEYNKIWDKIIVGTKFHLSSAAMENST